VDAVTLTAGDDGYRTFLSLSGDGIARFEMDEPLSADTAEEDQLQGLLRRGRVVECNELFARIYGRSPAEMAGLAMGDFVPANDFGRMEGIRQFIRSRYRLAHHEEEHVLGPGSSRFWSASALGLVEDGCLRGFWVSLREVTERRRAEADRERQGRILEAVAFSAARLLQPGTWRAHADEVLARLGQAAQVARAFISEQKEDPDGSTRIVFSYGWSAPGVASGTEDPRIQGGVSIREFGLESLVEEFRAGRSVVTLVRNLGALEQTLPAGMGSKSFAAVPISSNGHWWGFMNFGETRYEREWSVPEVEALKAAAAVLGAAIERERADEALRESEERLRRLAAATFEGIALTADGFFLDANDQLARMLGCSVGDLVGQSVEDYIPPEHHELVRTHRERGSEDPYEHSVRRRDGSLFPVEVRARNTPYGGRMVRVTAVHDITARVQAEDRQHRLEADLRQAAEEWRQTFDALDLGIVLGDAEGRIARLNRGALELAAGPSFGDAVGRGLDELPDQEPWPTVRRLYRQVGEAGVSVTAEAREAATGRSFFLLGSPWFRETGPPWCVLTFRDVTDFTAIQEKLRRAQTMEAMGSLVAGVAHEVRNPLFSISASVDALEAEIGPRPEFSEYAVLLRSQVERLTQLMRDLLDYGRPSVLRRTPTSLGDVVRRVHRACASLARDRKVTIEERFAPNLPSLDLDGSRVEQALENLLANALQHAPVASVVRIESGLDGDGPEAMVRCTVEDEGPGLPEDGIARIFEPFFTRRKGGTGLGLSIVQRVVEAHGGRVMAGNREGGGARFAVFFPVPRAPAKDGRG
jgi:PAS domain S-box-containing protein